MSPLTLRRYRAERLLRQEFEGLRGRVMATVRGRLGAGGARLDSVDLEACYAQAWQGLYAAVLDGQEIANPTGWLTLVTYRRAIEELRAQRHVDHGAGAHGQAGGEPAGRDGPAIQRAEEPDLAAELDDRMRLRHMFEGLRGRLSAREREAAAFCYLQGLSRSQAAERMGISTARMRKLMDGRGPGRPGVAWKVGELAETIRAGGWCEEQGSMMRGLAFGVLDPAGERYRLALIHHSECPACRAYVVSLRGLAVVLPPVLLPWGLGAEALLRAGVATHSGAGLGAHAGAGAQAAGEAGAGAGAQAGAGIGGAFSAPAAVSAGGAAGVGAGGSWLLAGGSLGTKLAVGCLLALGVGAGCVELTEGPLNRPAHRHEGARASRAHAPVRAGSGEIALNEDRLAGALRGSRPAGAAGGGGPAATGLTAAARAAREFGPERGPARVGGQSATSTSAQTVTATQSSTGSSRGAAGSGGASETVPAVSATGSSPAAAAASSPAEREFGIG